MFAYKDQTGKEIKFRPGNLAEEYRAWAQARGLGGHYGTTEGALKGWDTRGRGRKEPEKKSTESLRVAPLDDKRYFGFKSKYGKELKKNVDISLLPEESKPMLIKDINNLQDRCKELGLPELRGVIVDENNVYQATMGDGIITINLNTYQQDPKKEAARLITRNEERIKELEKRIEENKKAAEKKKAEWEKNNPDLIAKGATFETSPDGLFGKIPYLEENTRLCQEEIERKRRTNEALKARGIDVLKSSWKPGDPLERRGFTADTYFNFEDKHKIVLDHEFGHHIHQQMGVNAQNWKAPPVEIDIHDIFIEARKSDSFIAPTKYSDNGDPEEWFAESYALHVNGRDDLIDERLQKYFKEKKI